MKFNVDWMLRKWHAIIWIVLGQRTRAVAVFEEMLQAYPNDNYALGSLAHLKAELGDKKGAVAVYETLVKQHNAPAYAWFNLGFLQQELEHPVEAETAFRRALALNEQLDQAWYGLTDTTRKARRSRSSPGAQHPTTAHEPLCLVSTGPRAHGSPGT